MYFTLEVVIYFSSVILASADDLLKINCSPAGKAHWKHPFLTSGVCQQILHRKKTSIQFHQKVRYLYFNDSNLERIPDNWLINFTSLKELHLQNNNLKFLSSNSFKGLTQLELLDISFNSFTRLVESWFKNFLLVKAIKVDNCQIKYFQPKDFSWPVSLEYLSLKNNLIDVMPPMPLETVNRKIWNVSLEGNTIDCVCRRPEHNQTTFTQKMFQMVHSSCRSRHNVNDMKPLTLKRDTIDSRIWLIWKKYLKGKICEGPVVELITRCDTDGKCKVKCQASGRPKPYVNILNNATDEDMKNFNETTAVAYSNVVLDGQNAAIKCETETVFMTQGTRSVSRTLLTTIKLSEDTTTTTETVTTQENVTKTKTKEVMSEQVNELIRLDEVLSYLKKISWVMYLALSVNTLSNVLFVYIVFKLFEKSYNEDDEINSDDIVIQSQFKASK